jgi:hypothetical protein
MLVFNPSKISLETDGLATHRTLLSPARQAGTVSEILLPNYAAQYLSYQFNQFG